MNSIDKINSCRVGTGSERDPFRSPDGTAGIQSSLNALSERGGLLNLTCGRYDIEKPIVFDLPSTCLDGGVWACNTDPNGVFETPFGTKLRMTGTDYPAILFGSTADPISGAIIRNLGVQGDIIGMDTRQIFDPNAPMRAAGLCLNSVRTDQCAFTKLSFCGLGSAVVATGNAEIDACIFENINTDGCANGFWFSPRASYYARVRACIMADNPYYGFYVGGEGKHIHNLEILDCHFVRCGGAFEDGDKILPAAVFLDNASKCAVTHCIFDAPGTFWYYQDKTLSNAEHEITRRKTPALRIVGNENRIRDNTFLNSSDDSVTVIGNGNILLGNIADGNVRIRGKNNVVSNLIFTKSGARLILEADAAETTVILGVEEYRIIRI